MRQQFSSSQFNQWVNLSRQEKYHWLLLVNDAFFDNHRPYTTETNRHIELDGRLLTDEFAFYCHMGEVVNGPGGYFGMDIHSFYDCLWGGFGLDFPYSISWYHSDISRKYLNASVLERWCSENTIEDEDDLYYGTVESFSANCSTYFDALIRHIRFAQKQEKGQIELKLL